MTYIVTFSVQATYDCVEDADSIEEALEQAKDRFDREADWGSFWNVEAEPECVTDRDGKWLWPKLVPVEKEQT